jgi:predicted naringenin-chalcone synthase
LPPHGYSQHEVTGSFIRFPGFEVFEDMVRKLFASSKVLELDFGVLLQLVPKGSHRMEVRELAGPFLVWSPHADPKLGD